MKILIDHGGYELRNMGDLAMLQVAITRLRSLWPNASIKVFTTEPEKFLRCCPGTEPLSPSGREIWLWPLFHPMYKLLPHQGARQQYANLEWKVKEHFPRAVSSFLRFKLKFKEGKQANLLDDFSEFIEIVQNSDLVVATGGGYITDVFESHACSVLETLSLATKLGKPTAMFGQGLGPAQSPKLIAKAKKVLPSVNLISLRESRAGVPLLNSLGVHQNHFTTTGDDAIELVYKNRSENLGNGIGVNLR
ncbi:MAG TPA: polysaccharide pyruvyl transferase family protein, partial [Coleofasciculaceae cyanobacterium]